MKQHDNFLNCDITLRELTYEEFIALDIKTIRRETRFFDRTIQESIGAGFVPPVLDFVRRENTLLQLVDEDWTDCIRRSKIRDLSGQKIYMRIYENVSPTALFYLLALHTQTRYSEDYLKEHLKDYIALAALTEGLTAHFSRKYHVLEAIRDLGTFSNFFSDFTSMSSRILQNIKTQINTSDELLSGFGRALALAQEKIGHDLLLQRTLAFTPSKKLNEEIDKILYAISRQKHKKKNFISDFFFRFFSEYLTTTQHPLEILREAPIYEI